MSNTVLFEEASKGHLTIQLRNINGRRFRVVTILINPNRTIETTDEAFEDFDSARLHQEHLVRVSLAAGWKQISPRPSGTLADSHIPRTNTLAPTCDTCGNAAH